jgi:hypothetical protein
MTPFTGASQDTATYTPLSQARELHAVAMGAGLMHDVGILAEQGMQHALHNIDIP